MSWADRPAPLGSRLRKASRDKLNTIFSVNYTRIHVLSSSRCLPYPPSRCRVRRQPCIRPRRHPTNANPLLSLNYRKTNSHTAGIIHQTPLIYSTDPWSRPECDAAPRPFYLPCSRWTAQQESNHAINYTQQVAVVLAHENDRIATAHKPHLHPLRWKPRYRTST